MVTNSNYSELIPCYLHWIVKVQMGAIHLFTTRVIVSDVK